MLETYTRNSLIQVVYPTTNAKNSNLRSSIRQVDFGDEQQEVKISIADTTVKAKTIGFAQHVEPDLALQGVQFFVSDLVPGVGYSVSGYAPNGASGVYSVKIVLGEES